MIQLFVKKILIGSIIRYKYAKLSKKIFNHLIFKYNKNPTSTFEENQFQKASIYVLRKL